MEPGGIEAASCELMKKKWIVIVVLVAAVAAGIGLYLKSRPAEASNELITAPVTAGDVVETVQSTGTLEAVTTVQVGTQVSGTIKALHADFNSEVKAGQVVAELEPSLFEAQVEQARATLTRLNAELDRAKVQVEDATLKLKRAKELSARQLIPAADLETAESTARQAQSAVKSAEAQIVQARASLNQTQVNLEHTIIRAPIDGIVVSRNVDVGQTVAASMQAPTLFVIARDMTQMQVSASIDESDIGRITSGQAVTFRVDAYPEDRFSGTVQQVRLQPVVTSNVVSYTTIISVPNHELKLKPGMTATVTIEIARANDVLRVPSSAFRFRPTAEVFASLGQTPPTNMGEGERRATRRPVAGTTGAADAQDNQPARGGDQQGGADGGRRGGRFANMSPEERQQMRERMQNMSPEERQQMRERFMRQREGGDQPAGDAAAQAAPGRQQAPARAGQPPAKPASGNAAAAEAAAPKEAPRPVMRPVWVLENGKIQRLVVPTGISDGAMTAVLGGPLKEGAKVVTGVVQPQAAQGGGGANPLMPFGGRFPGGGGGRNFGGGGAGGGNRGPAGGGGR